MVCDSTNAVVPGSTGSEGSLFAPLAEAALLDTGGKIQLVPGRIVLVTVIIPPLKIMATVEIKLPHILAHGVTPYAAAGKAYEHGVVVLRVDGDRIDAGTNIAGAGCNPR